MNWFFLGLALALCVFVGLYCYLLGYTVGARDERRRINRWLRAERRVIEAFDALARRIET